MLRVNKHWRGGREASAEAGCGAQSFGLLPGIAICDSRAQLPR